MRTMERTLYEADHESFRQSVKEFLDREVEPHLEDWIEQKAIPREFYESAELDGAGWWKQEREITIPILRRTIAMAVIISVIGSLLAFSQFYILTRGGPGTDTTTVVQYIYNRAFVQLQLGAATALSLPQAHAWNVVGSGWTTYADALRERLPAAPHWAEGDRYPQATDVALLAAPLLRAGKGVSAEQALPVYLRDKVALTLEEQRAAR